MQPTEHRKQNKGSKPTKADQEESKHIQKCFERFSKAEIATADKRTWWTTLDMFDRSEQWKDADLPPWVPKPVHNMIRYTRTIKRANLTGNIPAATFAPLNVDHKDIIAMLQKAYKHVWTTQRVSYMIRRCVDRSVLQGTSIAYVYSDDGYIGGEYYGENNPKNRMYQGEIRVKRIANPNFFPDPDATCLEECKWLEITELTTLAAIKANKKFQEYAGKKLDSIKANAEHSNSAAGTIFDRDHNPLDSAQQIKGDERMVLHSHWEYVYDEKDVRQLNVTWYVAGYNFALYKVEDYKPSIFPFAVLYDEEEEGDFWGTSISMEILEKQKLINKTEQTASIIGTLNQNPQKVIARESGINAQDMARTGTMPGKVWTSNIDPSRSVFNIPVPEIPKGLFELADRAKADVKDIVGINEAYTGDSVGSLTTSTGVNSLIERATIRDKDKMKQIDRFVEQLSEIIVLTILEKWKQKRPIIDIDKNGQVTQDEWEPIKGIDHKNIGWFVRSDVYATAPLTQALKKQLANELMQMQQQFQPNPPLITLEEWLSFQDFEGKEEIQERMRRDQAKIEEQKARDLASEVMNLADQMRQMLRQGIPYEQVQQQATQLAQQMLDSLSRKENSVGFQGESGDRNRDAAKNVQGPGGTMDFMNAANMTRGAM